MSLVLKDLGQEYAMWDALLQISREAHPKSYLEIGSRYGDSLLRVLLATNLWSEIPVLERITVADLWHVSWFGANHGGTGFDQSHKHIERMLEAFGYHKGMQKIGQIKFLDGDSRITIPTLPADDLYDLALVDGDHDCEKPDSFMTDMSNVWPHIAKGGYMVCDDVNEAHMKGELEKFWDAHKNECSEFLRRHDKKWGVGVFQKK